MMRRIAMPLMISAAAALAGCGSPYRLPPVADAGAARPSTPSAPLPPAGSGRGGYYQDDGPGDAPPPGLMETPDAVPRIEAYSRTGNRPYVVFGKSYVPITDDRPFKQRGMGSWYGKKFHGQKTSSGEIYDMYKMTAAHPTLPIPSYVRVTSVSNGKQVIVRVNDRGPFLHNRIIDLSYTAALKLGYIGRGSTELEVERILPDEIRAGTATATPVAAQPADAAPVSSAPAQVVERSGGDAASAVSSSAVATPVAAVAPASAVQTAVPGFYLQMGAYSLAANAEAARSRLVGNWGNLPLPEVVQSGSLYRVHSGPFATRAEAEAAARQLRDSGAATPVVVQR